MLILAAAAALRLLSCKQLFLPPVTEIEQCDRTERSASFAVCTFRDAAVGAAINRYVEERVRDEAGYEDASEVAKRPMRSLNDILSDTTLTNQDFVQLRLLQEGKFAEEQFDYETLADNNYVRQVLDKAGLTDDLAEMGRKVAATMVELFAGLPPEHEFFRQFSFISAEAIREYIPILGDAENGEAALAEIAAAAFRSRSRSISTRRNSRCCREEVLGVQFDGGRLDDLLRSFHVRPLRAERHDPLFEITRNSVA